MRRWVALAGLLGLLAAAAPGAVTIDAKKHCEVVDWSQKAVSVTLDPGEYSADVVSGEIRYGRKIGAIRSQLLMAADPTAVSDLHGQPAAFFDVDYNPWPDDIGFRVERRTTVRFFLVDTVVEGNSGSVTVEIRDGRSQEFADNWEERPGPLVTTVQVDAVKNCYELGLKRAYQLELNPGDYDLTVVRGNVQFEQSDAARRRPCASLLFDFNPQHVMERDQMAPDTPEAPICNGAAPGVDNQLIIHVTRKTTVRLFLLTDSPDDNSGSVTVSVKADAPYAW